MSIAIGLVCGTLAGAGAGAASYKLNKFTNWNKLKYLPETMGVAGGLIGFALIGIAASQIDLPKMACTPDEPPVPRTQYDQPTP